MRAVIISAVLLLSLATLAAERPLIGNAKNGDESGRSAGFEPKVDGAWLNQFPDDVIIEKLVKGDAGFPQIDSENVLDRWTRWLRCARATPTSKTCSVAPTPSW